MTEPVIAAHRGLDEFAPENTASAFISAFELGMAVEFDVRQTADGELVVMHDPTLDRTTNGVGLVEHATLSQIRSLDAGIWHDPRFAGASVPTLEELLVLAKAHGHAETTLVLETKVYGPDIPAQICRLLERHALIDQTIGIGTIMVSAEVRERFLRANPDFPSSVVANDPSDLPAAVADPHASWVYARFVPSPSQVETARDAGKRIIASGLGVMNIVEQAYASLIAGADAVISNHPVDLAAVWRDHRLIVRRG